MSAVTAAVVIILVASERPTEKGEDRVSLARWCLWLVISLGLGARIIYAFVNSPLDKIYLDALMEYNYAKAYPHANLFETFLASGYPLWLKLELALTGENRVAIGLITAFMSVCTPWIWYRWMREHFRVMQLKDEELLSLIGLAILTWLPSWISIYSLFMPECLLLPLVGLALWLTSFSKRTHRSWGYLAAAAVWSAAYLTKASMLAMACIQGVWLLKDLFATSRGARAYWLSCACLGVLISAYLFETTRVYSSTHTLNLFAGNTVLNSLSYHSGGEKLHGTISVTGDGGIIRRENFALHPPSLRPASAPFAPLTAWHTERHGDVDVDVDYTRPAGHQFPKLALTPAQQAEYTFENAVFLIFGESWPDCGLDDLFHRLQVHARWMWAPLLVLASVLAIKQRRKDLLTILCFAPWLLFIFQQVYITEGRFRKPLEGILIAECIVLVYSEIRSSRNRAMPQPAGQPLQPI